VVEVREQGVKKDGAKRKGACADKGKEELETEGGKREEPGREGLEWKVVWWE